jgi:hypothetical protein
MTIPAIKLAAAHTKAITEMIFRNRGHFHAIVNPNTAAPAVMN